MAVLSAEFLHHGTETVVITVLFLLLDRVNLSPATKSETTMWCADVCDCYNNMETLDCSQRELGVIPGPLPRSARRVYLEDNDIGQVDPEEFTGSRRVSQLVLDRNRLTSVDTTTFCAMTSLQELSLSANMIKSFQVTRTEDCVCVALRQLDLSLNLLTTVPVNLSAFAPGLEVLHSSCFYVEDFLKPKRSPCP